MILICTFGMNDELNSVNLWKVLQILIKTKKTKLKQKLLIVALFMNTVCTVFISPLVFAYNIRIHFMFYIEDIKWPCGIGQVIKLLWLFSVSQWVLYSLQTSRLDHTEVGSCGYLLMFYSFQCRRTFLQKEACFPLLNSPGQIKVLWFLWQKTQIRKNTQSDGQTYGLGLTKPYRWGLHAQMAHLSSGHSVWMGVSGGEAICECKWRNNLMYNFFLLKMDHHVISNHYFLQHIINIQHIAV